MGSANMLKALLPVCLAGGVALAHCEGNMGRMFDGTSSQGGTQQIGDVTVPSDAVWSEVSTGCDPDGMAACVDAVFLCTDLEGGGKICRTQLPATPDASDGWDCTETNGSLTCNSGDVPGDNPPPTDGSNWDCREVGDGEFVCESNAFYPAYNGEGTWSCEYDGEFRVCQLGDGSGSDGPPEPVVDGCVCRPGAVRFCDTPVMCRWGIQECNDATLDWGPCIETTSIPMECVAIDGWYSPGAERCCINGGHCCQDMWDIDGDGDTWESLGDCTDITCE